MATPDFDDDYLDSRDVIARVTELRLELAEPGHADPGPGGEHVTEIAEARDELTGEIAAWEELREDFGDDARWESGVTLIRDLGKYMEQVVDAEYGDAWFLSCIDWGKALDLFGMDYTELMVTDHWAVSHSYFVRA